MVQCTETGCKCSMISSVVFPRWDSVSSSVSIVLQIWACKAMAARQVAQERWHWNWERSGDCLCIRCIISQKGGHFCIVLFDLISRLTSQGLLGPSSIPPNPAWKCLKVYNQSSNKTIRLNKQFQYGHRRQVQGSRSLESHITSLHLPTLPAACLAGEPEQAPQEGHCTWAAHYSSFLGWIHERNAIYKWVKQDVFLLLLGSTMSRTRAK